MNRRRIVVLANSGFLRRSIELVLTESFGQDVEVACGLHAVSGQADIVIAVDSACPPVECAQLAGKGAAVVVLAAIPTPGEEARYRMAGAAAYLPMEVDAHLLLAAAGGAGLGTLAVSRTP